MSLRLLKGVLRPTQKFDYHSEWDNLGRHADKLPLKDWWESLPQEARKM